MKLIRRSLKNLFFKLFSLISFYFNFFLFSCFTSFGCFDPQRFKKTWIETQNEKSSLETVSVSLVCGASAPPTWHCSSHERSPTGLQSSRYPGRTDRWFSLNPPTIQSTAPMAPRVVVSPACRAAAPPSDLMNQPNQRVVPVQRSARSAGPLSRRAHSPTAGS